ncbi:hypothetical protein MMC17_001764 [Xylographa soralifera]|nr:hypothetical protein [Xylographa soralifera]
MNRQIQKSYTTAVLPVIFDDSVDSSGAGGLEDGESQGEGVLGKAEIRAALLSMSGYGKPQYPDSNGELDAPSELRASIHYESSQPSPNPMYLTYAQPGFAQPHGLPSSSAYARHTNQQHYATNALFQPQGPFEEPSLSYPTVRSRHIPEVSSFAPHQGSQGTRIFISLSAYDEDAVSSLTFYAMFATRRCSGSLTKAGNEGAYGQYTLSVDAPPFTSTGWTNRQVPLRIQIQDGSGMDAELKDVGLFTYVDASQQAPQLSPQDVTRKRKISIESGEASRIPAKRPSTQQLRPSSAELYGAQVYLHQPGAAYMQQPPLEVESSLTNLMPVYNRPQSQGGYQQQESPRRVSHHLSTSSGSSLSQMRVPSPQTPSWSPSTITASHSAKSPNLAAPITRVPSVSSPASSTTPILIRTSTLQQTPSPGTTPVGPSTSTPFNPYAMYPHKAILKINGDLDLMAEDWTEDEFDVKRRLVQFWRSQTGSTINTNFKPVTPDDRQPNSICISCIWWESKKECYVTSVDTIYLLESLVAVRFTVEEKNRIRRNLEGFRPMTVSKGKPDSEDFFKLIMGFPNPKPRNIEKDVKVFPWKILAHALKKIIGKYSASYSSTASALPPSAGSSYCAPRQPYLGTELFPSTLSNSASHSTFTTGLTSTRLSPAAMPYSSAGSGMLQVTQPHPATYPHSASNPPGGSSAVLSSLDPLQRPSWDFPSYIETNPGHAAPALQGIYYQPRTSGHPEASSTAYQMTHTSSGP